MTSSYESINDKSIHNKLPVTGYINTLPVSQRFRFPVFNYYGMRKRY